MLGPAVCIQRTPLCGRNFEYMGEDPFLAARMAVNYVEGEQAQGVGSCIKHFAANSQEFERRSINEIIDERTLREIYLPAFRAAVEEAGVISIMSAYNQINGQYCSENVHLLKDILKEDWGFKGVVISDWGAVHHTDLTVLNGLDIEMGDGAPYQSNYLAAPFLSGLQSRQISRLRARRHGPPASVRDVQIEFDSRPGGPGTHQRRAANALEHEGTSGNGPENRRGSLCLVEK